LQPSPPFAILIGMRWVLLGVAGLCGCSSSAGSAPGAETGVDAGHVADAAGAHDAAAAAVDAADAGEALDAGLEAAVVDPYFGTKCQGATHGCQPGLVCCPGYTTTGIDPSYDGGVNMVDRCTQTCASDADCTGASDSRGVFPPGTRCVITSDGAGHTSTPACVPPTQPSP
jgi:hypothetical protein